MQIPKYIFVDLDETLICTSFWDCSKKDNAKFLELEDPIFGKSKYWSLLRPGAHKLLKELRNIGQVYMLTAATQDYARGWNKSFNLGFTDLEIFSREDYSSGEQWKIFESAPDKRYLIDNLPATSTNSIGKLHFLTSDTTYIQIPQYDGFDNQELTDAKIEKIVSQIV